MVAGSRLAGHMTLSMFSGTEARKKKRSKVLSEQAKFLVGELGKLKGSVVKIGQVMALYGEHFLPVEVTEALHTLEDSTHALDWSAIHEVLIQELGADKLSQLEVEETPIGTASLGQVHRARVIATGEIICLKVQYPGVAQAIDADLNSVAQLLRLARVVRAGPMFDEWLEEVRQMMHREVDYKLEARTTAHFFELLEGDSRYVVPSVYFEYSTAHVLATSYEKGESISSQGVADLSLDRRNELAIAALELFLNELYIWHEIQTDPNFGNYRIRIADDGCSDQIVLLDFGAVQKYPPAFIEPICQMIDAAYHENLEDVIKGGIALRFMQSDWPRSVLEEFGRICIAVLEPLAKNFGGSKHVVLNDEGAYCWADCDLPSRIAKRAAVSAVNRYFKVPPKEFVFLNRKLVGVYTFIAVLRAEFNGQGLLSRYAEQEKL